jgi:hypothetical protein
MLRHFALIATCLLVAAPAFASKARLLALGQSANGSLYIDDSRSIFLNPAMLNKTGSFANFEFGATALGPTTAGAATSAAEGGFFRDFNGTKGGIQLGVDTNANTQIGLANQYVDTTVSLIAPQNSFEVIFAGGAATKWGVGVVYGSSEDKAEVTTPGVSAYPNRKANTLELRGGLLMDKIQAYGKLDLQSHAETENAAGQVKKYDMRPSVELGGAFDLDADSKIYGSLGLGGFAARASTATQDREGNTSAVNIGYVQFLTPEAGARFFYTAGLSYTTFNLKNFGGAAEDKIERVFVPLVLGIEQQATDWMVLRAAVGQSIILDQRKTTVTDISYPHTTTVSAGTGFKWKRMLFDAYLAAAGTGSLNGNSLFTNAALTYMF